MRFITKKEHQQRGCAFCTDVQSTRGMQYDGNNKGLYAKGRACPYNECPYHEMDEYTSYKEFCAALEEECSKLLEGIAS